eukprot:COSAG05_NODE_122_length_17611_cov_47.044655_10_plen_77_part_00
MALGYAWFDSYDSVGYVVTLHISPFAVCPYLPIAKSAFLLYRRIFFTIDYEGLIIISIEVLRREIARELLPITFQS